MGNRPARLLGVALLALAACGGGDGSGAAVDAGADDGGLVRVNVEVRADDGGDDADGLVCPPGERFCVDGSTWAQCKASGRGHGLTHACASSTVCDAPSGVCTVPFCTPGETRCAGLRSRERCSETGTSWGEISGCPEEGVCHEGACTACVPDQPGCVDTTTAGVCNADGTALEQPAPCGADEGCHEFTGTCRERVCTPGEPGCAGVTALHTCLPSGTGWDTELFPCESGHRCVHGGCVLESCLANVVLLVDRSGSMVPHWPAVEASVKAVVAHNPKAAFGIVAFPSAGLCDVSPYLSLPMDYHDEAALEAWFQARAPHSGILTPLAQALLRIQASAGTIFGPSGGALVVLSDGVDTCEPADVAVPSQLGATAAALRDAHQVQTWVIGYNFAGSDAQLRAIADSGGTGSPWIPAGDEAELTDAFQAVVNDFKLCLQEP